MEIRDGRAVLDGVALKDGVEVEVLLAGAVVVAGMLRCADGEVLLERGEGAEALRVGAGVLVRVIG